MATSDEYSLGNSNIKRDNLCNISTGNINSECGELSKCQNTVSANVVDTTKATVKNVVDIQNIEQFSKVDDDKAKAEKNHLDLQNKETLSKVEEDEAKADKVIDHQNFEKRCQVEEDIVILKSNDTKEEHFKEFNNMGELNDVAEIQNKSDSKLEATEYISDGNNDMDNILMDMGSEMLGLMETTHDPNVNDGTKATMHDTSDTCALHRRMPHFHKLEKKHSSGDLHSRLKTRKLLGVGETDDGDVHRSKLSQILGHSDQLFNKLPGGLRIWQVILSITFTVLSVWTLLFPSHFISAVYDMEGSAFTFAVRLYACSLICISVMHWSTLQAADRDVIRMVLLCSVVFFSLHTCVLAINMVCGNIPATKWTLTLFGLQMLCVFIGCLLHCRIVGPRTGSIKTTPNKDAST